MHLQSVMKLKYLLFVCVLFIVADTVYSFLQCYYMMVPDGDMAGIIVPSDSYSKVLQDPFGFSVLFKNEVYAATNRFFTHVFMGAYFKSVPFLFQMFVNPIRSVFLSMAAARILFHVSIIGLIAAYVSGGTRITSAKFISAAFIITPFFQIGGYERNMGITDASITYAFFYAGSVVFILSYFFPFYKSWYHQTTLKFSMLQHFLMLVLAFIIAFGGSIGSPIILIVCPSVLLFLTYGNFSQKTELSLLERGKAAIKATPSAVFFHFVFISCLCLYSFYIGRNNEENLWSELPLIDRYKLLPKGFLIILLKNTGVPLLVSGCLLNIFLLSKVKQDKASRKMQLLKYLVMFSFVYLILLPLGGYRSYRPYIIRYDTFLPVTICLIFTYSLTSVYLIPFLKGIERVGLILFIAAVMIHFTREDKINWEGNKCDKQALTYLSNSSDEIVFLDHWCSLMSWNKITDYRSSELNCRLLKHWKILKEEKLYYQKQN
jgi:hypothetical protein